MSRTCHNRPAEARMPVLWLEPRQVWQQPKAWN